MDDVGAITLDPVVPKSTPLLCNNIREKVADLAPLLLFCEIFSYDVQEVRRRDALVPPILLVLGELFKDGVHPLVEVVLQVQRVIFSFREGLP